jgi:hypothetical protein
VDFCADTFGAQPVYATVRPQDISFEDDFDLIWSGSLFTHLDTDRFVGFLKLFESCLTIEGLLVFTTNGRHTYEMLRRLLPDGSQQRQR